MPPLPPSFLRPLLGLTKAQLGQVAVSLGQPAYRGDQLHTAIYKQHIASLDDVAQLPKPFREALKVTGP